MSTLKDILRWCRRHLVPRTVRNWYVLRKWIRGNPLREGYMVDLSAVPSEKLGNRLFAILLQLANDPTTAQRPVNLALVLSPSGFALLSDLYSLISLLPKANTGNIEFFQSTEDCHRHHHNLVEGIYQFGFLPVRHDQTISLKTFRNPVWKIEPSIHYLNQGRAFLKTLGPNHLLYFCDLTHLQEEKIPERWNQFFSTFVSAEPAAVFLVSTPAHLQEQRFVHPNVFYIKSLGFNLLERFALVYLTDGFIGPMNVLAAMALQRDIPILLISDEIASSIESIEIAGHNADSTELRRAFCRACGKIKQPALSEPQPMALL